MIKELLNSKIDIVADTERVRPENSEVLRLICNNDKARRLTGWQPRIGLRDGLAETVAHVERHLSRYKADIYNV
jgi:nucleoside-diphosphate-sugar epimerase